MSYIPSEIDEAAANHRITKYSEIEGILKDHQVQFLSERPIQGSNLQP